MTDLKKIYPGSYRKVGREELIRTYFCVYMGVVNTIQLAILIAHFIFKVI